MVVCASALIVNVDNTILNVALPTLVRKLAATSSELQWIVDSYAMVFAGLLLVGGSLADRFGRKRFFPDRPDRLRRGIGRCRILRVGGRVDRVAGDDGGRGGADDPARRCRSSTTCSATGRSGPGRLVCGPARSALGIAIGPIAGGLLLARFWWGSVFLVNVPIVITAFAASSAAGARLEEPGCRPARSLGGRCCRSPA